jgi:hypothetical protein
MGSRELQYSCSRRTGNCLQEFLRFLKYFSAVFATFDWWRSVEQRSSASLRDLKYFQLFLQLLTGGDGERAEIKCTPQDFQNIASLSTFRISISLPFDFKTSISLPSTFKISISLPFSAPSSLRTSSLRTSSLCTSSLRTTPLLDPSLHASPLKNLLG